MSVESPGFPEIYPSERPFKCVLNCQILREVFRKFPEKALLKTAGSEVPSGSGILACFGIYAIAVFTPFAAFQKLLSTCRQSHDKALLQAVPDVRSATPFHRIVLAECST